MATNRERLLDAAYDAALGTAWERIRMADVAAAAGVSRQTLYNEFGTRDALGQALALREAQRYLDGTAELVAEATNPADAVAKAMDFTLREAAGNPLLKAVLTDDIGLLPYLTTRAEPLVATARDEICRRLLGHWPRLDPAGVALVAETVVRLTISYLMLPAGADTDVAAGVSRLVEKVLPL